MSTTPLTDAIEALTRYANETTGASDTTLSDAVGTLVAGYGGGGGGDPSHWVRPSEWPDYSQLDISQEEAIYFTYVANTPNSFVGLNITATGTYTAQVGTLENGTYTALSTDTLSSSGVYYKKLTGYATNYVVVRVAGTITKIQFTEYSSTTVSDRRAAQYCVEVFGRLPNAGDMTDFARQMLYLESVTLKDMASVTTLQRFGAETKRLQSVDVSGIVNRVTGYLMLSGSSALRFLYLHGVKLNNVQSVASCPIEYSDCENWDVITTGGLGSLFNGARLAKLDLSSWDVTVSSGAAGIFRDCIFLADLNISTWTITGTMNDAFRNTALRTVPALDYSGVNSTASMFNSSALSGDITLPTSQATTYDAVTQYCNGIKKLTVPSNYTTINGSAFRGMNNCEEIHFLATTPPTLANSNAFTIDMNALLKIYVPYSADHSILTAYQTASNWSAVADKIVEESA